MSVLTGVGFSFVCKRSPEPEDRQEVVAAEALVASFGGLDSSLHLLDSDENRLLTWTLQKTLK